MAGIAIPRVKPRPTRSKMCPQCDQWLAIDSFSLDRKRADGRESRCRACRADRRNRLRSLAKHLRYRVSSGQLSAEDARYVYASALVKPWGIRHAKASTSYATCSPGGSLTSCLG